MLDLSAQSDLCNLCHVQYVGETQNPLHIRLNGHRSDIRHRHVDKLVAAHFNSSGHSLTNLSICACSSEESE